MIVRIMVLFAVVVSFTSPAFAGKTVDRLPLQHGWYLPEGSSLSCKDIVEGPSAETEGMFLSYDGKSLNSSAHEDCKITRVENKGNLYKITTSCQADERMGNTESVDHTQMTIQSNTSFTMVEDKGKSQTYRWKCALPKGSRDVNLIRHFTTKCPVMRGFFRDDFRYFAITGQNAGICLVVSPNWTPYPAACVGFCGATKS